MTTVSDDDLFSPVEGKPQYGLTSEDAAGNEGGRYRYPAPPDWTGRAPKPSAANPLGLPTWMRATNLVSAFSDQERLQLWLTWKAFMGLRTDDGLLFDEWMAMPIETLDAKVQSAQANLMAEKARGMAGGNAAARRGTARHEMMHTYLSEGVVTGTRSMRLQLQDAMAALDAHGFDVVKSEFKVWHPAAGGTMGTSDVEIMCRRTGQLGILDWKTQARFWTWQEPCGQLRIYDAARWHWSGPPDPTGRWVRAEPHTLTGTVGHLAGQRVALVAHMPQAPGPGQLPVELHEVSMTYGQDVLDTAVRNVELRSVGRSTATGRRPSNPRPRP